MQEQSRTAKKSCTTCDGCDDPFLFARKVERVPRVVLGELDLENEMSVMKRERRSERRT
jgi:hypothetical protein